MQRTNSSIDWVDIWNAFWRGFLTAVLFGMFAAGIPGARPRLDEQHTAALGVARDHLFDFVAWEVGSLADKAANGLLAPQRYMDEHEQTEYVRDYLELITHIRTVDKAVQSFYIDPDVTNPDAASADLIAFREALRTEQELKQALAEAIVESQVSEVLIEYGFGALGQTLPPTQIRFTQLPTIMIVSPRDHIERTGSYALEHGLTVDQMAHIEEQVDQELDVSSLIAPLGGLAVYPAMLIETDYLPHVYEVGSHEWAHHYLTFFPLGISYGLTPELYTINETVASILGDEIGWAVLNRYYPDLAPAPPDYTPVEPEPPSDEPPPPPDPNVFDFRTAMRETRVRADELLAAGKIEEAEAYMEERRVMFVEHGYAIRKINQAYFAFYGAYADQPGATGADPIGPALRDLRYYSASLHDFMVTVRGVTSLAEIQTALAEAKREYQAGR